MLRELRIKNFAVIDEVALELSPGLNFTGPLRRQSRQPDHRMPGDVALTRGSPIAALWFLW